MVVSDIQRRIGGRGCSDEQRRSRHLPQLGWCACPLDSFAMSRNCFSFGLAQRTERLRRTLMPPSCVHGTVWVSIGTCSDVGVQAACTMRRRRRPPASATSTISCWPSWSCSRPIGGAALAHAASAACARTARGSPQYLSYPACMHCSLSDVGLAMRLGHSGGA